MIISLIKKMYYFKTLLLTTILIDAFQIICFKENL